MKKIIILLLGLFIFCKAEAQISGYMGKKFSIIASPSFSIPNLSLVTEGEGHKVNFAIQNAVKFEYIITNHMVLGVRYKYAFNSAPNDKQYSKYHGFTERYKFNSHTYGAYIKFHRKRNLAPLGVYFAIGLNLQNLSLNNLILPTLEYNSPLTSANYKAIDLGISLTWGRNWIVADRLLLGLEGEVMPTLIGIGKMATGTSLYSYNSQKENRVIYTSNLSTEVVKITLNVGFLIF